MEDTFIPLTKLGPSVAICAIFDGHGGYFVWNMNFFKGNEVSKFLEKKFINFLKSNEQFKKNKFKGALKECFNQIDDYLQSEEGNTMLLRLQDFDTSFGLNSRKVISGSTALVALFCKSEMIIASVGDSKAVMSVNGKAVNLSTPHKPTNPEENERIEKAGGEVIGGRINGMINVSHTVGDFQFKNQKKLGKDEQLVISKPEIKVRKLTFQDEFLILGSDGVFEKYSDDAIVDYFHERIVKNEITSYRNLSTTLNEFLDTCINKHPKEQKAELGCDNMTAILIVFELNKIIQRNSSLKQMSARPSTQLN